MKLSPDIMGLLSSLNLIACFIFIALFLAFRKHWRRPKNSNSNRKFPPGPRKLPLIGNLHNLIGSAPHHAFRDLAKKHGPLIHLKLGEVEAIVASSPRLAKDIMNTHDLSFVDRLETIAWKIITYNNLDFALSSYSEYWRQSRRICVQELLSPKKVHAFRTIREDEFSHLIANILQSDGKPFNLTTNILSSIIKVVSRVTFGKVYRDHDTFVRLIMKIFRLGGQIDLVDLFPSYKMSHALNWTGRKMMKLRQKLDLILDEVIKEHEEEFEVSDKGNREDIVENVIDIFRRLKDSGDLQIPMGYDNIKAIIFNLFAGGTETSASVIDWAMAEMMKNPHVIVKAKNEIRQAMNGKKTIGEDDIKGLKYLGLVIKETLRLHPPGPVLVPRQCRKECELDGYKIPVGTKVFINAWAIARDPEYWDDPESFVPERFDNNSIDFSGRNFEYLPFGAGRRMCPGSLFGLANVELPLALLLYHFEWKLPNGINFNNLDMTEESGLVSSRKNHLYLVPTPYDPLSG